MHSWHLLLPLTILVSDYFPLSNSGSKYAGYMNAVHICSTVSALYLLTATLGAIIDLNIVKLPRLLSTLRLSLGMRRRTKTKISKFTEKTILVFYQGSKSTYASIVASR